MKTEREGQSFGIKCWKEGITVDETLEKAAKECGLDQLPKNSMDWPKFVHGAEEAWQDQNLDHMDEKMSLSKIKGKHVKHK